MGNRGGGGLSERPLQGLGLFCGILERAEEAGVVLDGVPLGSRGTLLAG